MNFGGGSAEGSNPEVHEARLSNPSAVGDEDVGDGVTSLDVRADLDMDAIGLVDRDWLHEFEDDPTLEVLIEGATETHDQIQVTRPLRGYYNVNVDGQGEVIDAELTHAEPR